MVQGHALVLATRPGVGRKHHDRVGARRHHLAGEVRRLPASLAVDARDDDRTIADGAGDDLRHPPGLRIAQKKVLAGMAVAEHADDAVDGREPRDVTGHRRFVHLAVAGKRTQGGGIDAVEPVRVGWDHARASVYASRLLEAP